MGHCGLLWVIVGSVGLLGPPGFRLTILAFLINFCLLKMYMLLASLAMVENETFSVIFKHRAT